MTRARSEPLDPRAFRRVAGLFATGVSVMTSRVGDHLHGMTVNTFCTVSLHPLLMLVCVDREAHMHGVVEQAGVFALTFLSREQEELSRRFANKDREFGAVEFQDVPHRTGTTGCPILAGGLAFLEGRVKGIYPGGDHSIVVAAVTAMGIERQRRPLLFFGGRYQSLAQKEPARAK